MVVKIVDLCLFNSIIKIPGKRRAAPIRFYKTRRHSYNAHSFDNTAPVCYIFGRNGIYAHTLLLARYDYIHLEKR